MKFGIITFPGTNCEHDCYWVVKKNFYQDADYIWHKETSLEGYDCLIIPGGFSYGDYLRTGSMAKSSPVMASVKSFAEKGGLVIGICNGFQILLECGLLPGAMRKNDRLRFICENTSIIVSNNDTPFTSRYQKNQILKMPIRHAEGNYYIDKKGLDDLVSNDQIVVRYCDQLGDTAPQHNPNGSVLNIAGICNREKNVFGLMPHPEAACESPLGSEDGKGVFESIISKLS